MEQSSMPMRPRDDLPHFEVASGAQAESTQTYDLILMKWPGDRDLAPETGLVRAYQSV